MREGRQHPFVRIGKYLPYLEVIALALIIAGVALAFSGNGSIVRMIGILLLAGVYFQYAFQRIELNLLPDEKQGFTELLRFSIVPKVLWLSCSVSLVGIAFYLLKLTPQSYQQLLLIGAVTLASGFVILLPAVLGHARNADKLVPLLYRAAPLVVLDIYLLMK
jgi:hypothetical protein